LHAVIVTPPHPLETVHAARLAARYELESPAPRAMANRSSRRRRSADVNGSAAAVISQVSFINFSADAD